MKFVIFTYFTINLYFIIASYFIEFISTILNFRYDYVKYHYYKK
jgi:hypothetical protein